jgi:hypothetical protein
VAETVQLTGQEIQVVNPDGSQDRVNASAPVQIFGLLGDTNLGTMVPFRPLLAIP